MAYEVKKVLLDTQTGRILREEVVFEEDELENAEEGFDCLCLEPLEDEEFEDDEDADEEDE